MLRAGKSNVPRLQAKGESLPIRSASFDFLTIGYALRHFADLRALFVECNRVMRPGGAILILEITPPRSRVGYAALRFHLNRIVPMLARLRSGSAAAKTLMHYYWDTIDACVPPETILAALRDVDVIDAALARGGKLITGAAGVYASFIDSTLSDLQRSADHLEELSFNATDFTHGVAFRFVKTQSARVRSGNNYMRVEPETAGKIRLADAVAASSCFPGVFEPIVFPDDFAHALPAATSVPLMDGGIFDNSGIESLLLIRERC